MPWYILEIFEHPGEHYRFSVRGDNDETGTTEGFSWAVHDILDPRFVPHPDAPAYAIEAIKRAKLPMAKATRKSRVPCPGCVKKGVNPPALVKPGYQCNRCADIEEGAW